MCRNPHVRVGVRQGDLHDFQIVPRGPEQHVGGVLIPLPGHPGQRRDQLDGEGAQVGLGVGELDRAGPRERQPDQQVPQPGLEGRLQGEGARPQQDGAGPLPQGLRRGGEVPEGVLPAGVQRDDSADVRRLPQDLPQSVLDGAALAAVGGQPGQKDAVRQHGEHAVVLRAAAVVRDDHPVPFVLRDPGREGGQFDAGLADRYQNGDLLHGVISFLRMFRPAERRTHWPAARGRRRSPAGGAYTPAGTSGPEKPAAAPAACR